MKKYIMVFGLALVAGIGIFALTDSMAGTDLLASIVPTMGCGCETCGADCDCSADKMCGDADCGCSDKMAKATAATCSGSCTGGATCGATAATGSSCAATGASEGMIDATEVKTVGCGCGKHKSS